MGAHNIEMDLDGSLSSYDLQAKLKERQIRDRESNGQAEGYSGDFQTVDTVKTHNRVFNTYNEAHEYCLEHAEKWTNVIAVRYKIDVKFKPSAKLKTLTKKIKVFLTKQDKIKTKYNTWIDKAWEKRAPILAKKKTVKCGTCRSTLNLKYIEKIKAYGSGSSYVCPVCQRGLLTETQLKRSNIFIRDIAKIEAKLKDYVARYKALHSALHADAAVKTDKTRWLIAGWGAS